MTVNFYHFPNFSHFQRFCREWSIYCSVQFLLFLLKVNSLHSVSVKSLMSNTEIIWHYENILILFFKNLYLLDDPLSAVDAHVGVHIFQKCIQSALREKSVVMVTHQLQVCEKYLEKFAYSFCTMDLTNKVIFCCHISADSFAMIVTTPIFFRIVFFSG